MELFTMVNDGPEGLPENEGIPNRWTRKET
jgi:hypothetical protein